VKKLKLFGLAPVKDKTRLYALIKILNGRMARSRLWVFGTAFVGVVSATGVTV